MIRVATYGNYQSAHMNMMSAQARSQQAQLQVSSGKIGTSLIEFGRTSEAITALKSTFTRIEGFKETAKTTEARLTAQDLALERISSSATETRNAINKALAAGRTEGMMTEISALFQAVQDGLNTKHQGKYLFAGGAIDTVPSSVNGLNGLINQTDVASLFNNDRLKQSSWVDENINLETGMLADELGIELYEIYRDIANFNNDPNTTFNGPLTEAQRLFLTEQTERLVGAARNLVSEQATNGAALSRTESIVHDHTSRADTLEVMLSNKTDADLAKAATELDLSQLALQASLHVVSQLRQVSLLDYLR